MFEPGKKSNQNNNLNLTFIKYKAKIILIKKARHVPGRKKHNW